MIFKIQLIDLTNWKMYDNDKVKYMQLTIDEFVEENVKQKQLRK